MQRTSQLAGRFLHTPAQGLRVLGTPPWSRPRPDHRNAAKVQIGSPSCRPDLHARGRGGGGGDSRRSARHRKRRPRPCADDAGSACSANSHEPPGPLPSLALPLLEATNDNLAAGRDAELRGLRSRRAPPRLRRCTAAILPPPRCSCLRPLATHLSTVYPLARAGLSS